MLKLEVLTNAEDLDSCGWNNFVPVGEIFNRTEVLEALQKSYTEKAIMYFLLFKNKGTLVATAVVSVFDIHLDLFIGANSFINFIKKGKPRLFDKKIIFCGIPLSQGQSNLYISDAVNHEKVLTLLNEFMQQKAKEYNTTMLIYKEFSQEKTEQYKLFMKKNKYLQAYSIPNTLFKNNYSSFEEYLSMLRSTFRRQIKNSLIEIPFKIYTDFDTPERQAFIREINASEVDVDFFYDGYLSVMNRSKVKLEILNKEFFQILFRDNTSLKILQYIHNKEIIAMDVIAIVEEKLFFIWTSRKVQMNNEDYLNLLYAIILTCIQNRCTEMSLGQTSYYPKMRVGAQASELYIFIKSTNIFFHLFLKYFNKILFPKEKLPEIKAFKTFNLTL